MCRKAAPYGGMQNGSYGEKEKSRESKAKDTMVKTEGDKFFSYFFILPICATTLEGYIFVKQLPRYSFEADNILLSDRSFYLVI